MAEHILLIDSEKDIAIKTIIKKHSSCKLFIVDNCKKAAKIIENNNISTVIVNISDQNAFSIKKGFIHIRNTETKHIFSKILLINDRELIDDSELSFLEKLFNKSKYTYDIASNLGNYPIILKPLKDLSFTKEPLFSIFQKLNLQINSSAQNQRNTIAKSPLHQAFEVLNIPVDSSKEDVKKAYNILVKKHHPDNFCAEITAKEKQKLTTEFYKINEAYHMITAK